MVFKGRLLKNADTTMVLGGPLEKTLTVAVVLEPQAQKRRQYSRPALVRRRRHSGHLARCSGSGTTTVGSERTAREPRHAGQPWRKLGTISVRPKYPPWLEQER